jgi:hypothetical protein
MPSVDTDRLAMSSPPALPVNRHSAAGSGAAIAPGCPGRDREELGLKRVAKIGERDPGCAGGHVDEVSSDPGVGARVRANGHIVHHQEHAAILQRDLSRASACEAG